MKPGTMVMLCEEDMNDFVALYNMPDFHDPQLSLIGKFEPREVGVVVACVVNPFFRPVMQRRNKPDINDYSLLVLVGSSKLGWVAGDWVKRA